MNRLSGNTRVPGDEIWAFCTAKQKNVSNPRKAPAAAGMTQRLWKLEDLVRITDAYEAAQRALRLN